MNTLPPLFISHGSPMTALEPGAAGAFMARLGPAIRQRFGTPRAVLALSAHSLARQPVLLAAARHEAVHDFGGFPQALFDLRYATAGAPDLADEVATRLGEAGWPVGVLDQGGLDHGIWTPLRYLFPDGDVPVLPLAFVPSDPPARLFALGQALAPLAEQGVLIIGSGSLTHNLRLVYGPGGLPALDAPETAETRAFRDWVAARAAAADWPALLDYRRQAPHAALMHPTDEHWLPFYAAAGAGGTEVAPQRLHASVTYGVLAMDLYAFGPQAGALAQTLAQPSTQPA